MFESPMDEVLSATIRGYHLTARVFAHERRCGDWEINTSGNQRATFHLIGSGNCWLNLKGQAPLLLGAGDFILFPRDASNFLTGIHLEQPAAPCQDYTTVICGYLEFDNKQHNLILASLPEMMRINCTETIQSFQNVLYLLLTEAENAAIGRQAILDRLSEIMLVMVLRQHLAQTPHLQGFFAALADPRLYTVLSALHLNPGKAWCIDELATLAKMSRSAFIQRFSELLGEPPLAYLTSSRMRTAALLLEEGRAAVGKIAEQMGYQDEAAFRRAFKRVLGIGPGAVRKRRL